MSGQRFLFFPVPFKGTSLLKKFIPIAILFLSFTNCKDQTKELISLSGDWEAQKPGSRFDSPWEKRAVPFDLSDQHPGKDSCIRLKREIPQLAHQMLAEKQSLAVDTGHISNTATFYFNDEKFISMGRQRPHLSAHDARAIKVIPTHLFRAESSNQLLVEICTIPQERFYWRGPSIWIGRSEAVFDNFNREVAVAFILAAFYVSVGLYHLLLAVRRPQDIFNLYFAFFCLSFAFFHIANSAAGDLVFEDLRDLQSIVDQVALMIFTASMLMFITRFFGKRNSKIALVFSAMYVLFAIVDIFSPHAVRLTLFLALEISILFVLPFILFVTIREAVRKNVDAWFLLAGVGLIFVGVAHDAAQEARIINSFLILPYTFLVFVLGIAFILANRFVRVQNEVEELNTELEQKVVTRTAQLQERLTEIRELKQQQDGDYFLTSQLIDPLSGNYVYSDSVKADYVARQKKTFRFRKWESELGGDICSLYSLKLRGRDVVIFFNGDAMGKSMQGAGGALIMGTIFKIIIARTLNSKELSELYPEQWLHQCYTELQTVFVSFDGRMLVSLVLGILDEETGLLYFINAEHPSVVLYRDAKASFLKERGILRKVGVEDQTTHFTVQTFSLRPDDVIIVGSDGRDDIEIGRTPEHKGVINEDETAFLRAVEEAYGDLQAVESILLKKGTLIDDLSLIRLAYKEDYPSETNLSADYNLERKRLREFMEQKSFADALLLGEDFLKKFPEDSTALLWISHALAKSGRLADAIELGERLLLREPEHKKNREHLSRLYEKTGNRERAQQLRMII